MEVQNKVGTRIDTIEEHDEYQRFQTMSMVFDYLYSLNDEGVKDFLLGVYDQSPDRRDYERSETALRATPYRITLRDRPSGAMLVYLYKAIGSDGVFSCGMDIHLSGGRAHAYGDTARLRSELRRFKISRLG